MAKKISLINISFLMSFAVAYGCGKPELPMADESSAILSRSQCRSDADCTVVNADCCGCFKGGKQRALSLSKVKDFDAKMSLDCKGMMCAQFISKDESCSKKAFCDKGSCELK